MTSADAHPAGLDPAHILAICTSAAGGTAGIHAVAAPDGVRVSFPARETAWEASGALGRAGYTAALAGGGRARRDVLVTGWNTARLDARLTAMRSVMYHLAGNPLVTATAAVRCYAALPATGADPRAAAEILGQASHQLHAWADARAGICVPALPAAGIPPGADPRPGRTGPGEQGFPAARPGRHP